MPHRLLAVVLLLLVAAPAWAAPPALAIVDLVNNTGDETYDPLGPGVASLLVGRFLRTEAVTVVEREQLRAILDEMELSRTGLVDPTTAVRAGRLVGARYVVLGSLFSVRLPVLAIALRVVDTETGEVIVADDVTGDIGDDGDAFFVLVDKIAGAIVDGLDLELSDRDRVELSQVDIRELQALLDYGRSLDAPERESPKMLWRDKSRDILQDGSVDDWRVFDNSGAEFRATSFAVAVGDDATLERIKNEQARIRRRRRATNATAAVLVLGGVATLLALPAADWSDTQRGTIVAAGSTVAGLGLFTGYLGQINAGTRLARVETPGTWWTPSEADRWIEQHNQALVTP